MDRLVTTILARMAHRKPVFSVAAFVDFLHGGGSDPSGLARKLRHKEKIGEHTHALTCSHSVLAATVC